MKTFKPAACILIALGFFVTVSCEKDIETETDSDSDSESGNPTLSIIENCENHESADDYIWSSSSEISVVLNGTSITASSSAVTINGSIATITQAGNFNITGTLSNGQIVVNTESEETIRLILNGITVTCAKSAPIYIKKAKKVILVLPDGTQSTLTDGSSYTYDDAEEEEPNAAVFSKSDLSVFGTGTLIVNANFNDGISSKDGLIIKSGSIEVTSKDDGIRGKDYLIIRDGNIKIKSGGDGLKSDNDEDGSKGFINIDKGTFAINSTTDAISAQTDVEVAAGNFTLTSGGGSSSSVSSDVSAKAIKGTVSVILNCESMVISAADDALHTNNYMNIKGGAYTISSADDGLHADSTLIVNGGNINITKSYEGLEAANLTINDGVISLVASDDGVNAAGGSSSETTGGAPGGGGFPGGGSSSSGNYNLYMNGGYVFVNAGGDGIDINGSVVMKGGTLIVNGPTDNGNGPIDYDGTFNISGGTIVAAGSSGMAMIPSSASTQNSVLLTFSSALQAGTMFHIQNSGGTDILTFVPTKKYQSIAFSSSSLVKGDYDAYYGGSSTGTLKDGLYSGGTYSGGTKYSSFTVSSTATKVNIR